MSSDVMLVCREDNSSYYGLDIDEMQEVNSDKAFFIDEASAGHPVTEFGVWMSSRYCGIPSMFDQIAGIKELYWYELAYADVLGITAAFVTMERDSRVNHRELHEWLYSHIGKHIATENW